MTVLSTKILAPNQRELLLNAGVGFVDFDILKITPQTLSLNAAITNAIITSQNAARSVLDVCASNQNTCSQTRFFTVGAKTAKLLNDAGLQVVAIANNSLELAHLLIEKHREDSFTYFCGNTRRDELPDMLSKAQICFKEQIAYKASAQEKSFTHDFDAVLFYSPMGVSAFAKSNSINLAVCIGSTTAQAAQKHAKSVIIANQTTVESTIAKAVLYLKNVQKQS